jgi:hypothetical protein
LNRVANVNAGKRFHRLARVSVIAFGCSLAACRLLIDTDEFAFEPGGSDAGALASGAGDPPAPDASTEVAPLEPPPCPGCAIQGNCEGPGVSNPENPCLVCDPSRAVDAWSPNEGACDDGKTCTVDDTCRDGVCEGADFPCDDGVACNGTSRCDASGERCTAAVNQCPEGELCDTKSDGCVLDCDGCAIDGICIPAGQSVPGDPCLACQPEVSAASYTPVPGASCGNGPSECSLQDTCDEAGECLPNHVLEGQPCGDGVARACDAPDSCDGAGSCQLRLVDNGAACDDGAFCSSADNCQGGQCVGIGPCAAPLVCNETSDRCECDNGGCAVGASCVPPGSLNPGNGCEICDPGRTIAGYSANVGASCGRGPEACSGPDTCDGEGSCQPNDLGNDVVCRFASECEGAATCVDGVCPDTSFPDGTGCDDLDECTVASTCRNGFCTGGRPIPMCEIR